MIVAYVNLKNYNQNLKNCRLFLEEHLIGNSTGA